EAEKRADRLAFRVFQRGKRVIGPMQVGVCIDQIQARGLCHRCRHEQEVLIILLYAFVPTIPSRIFLISALEWTPTICSTTLPPLKKSRVGMSEILYRVGTLGCSSVFSLATRTFPEYSFASSSISGVSI